MAIHGTSVGPDVRGPERRCVSILRLEFAGLPELAESLDPDQVAALVEGLLELVTEPISHTDGVLLSHPQAGVVAIWNTPIREQSNHAQLALAAGRAAMAAGSAGGRPSGLSPRAAVVTGEAVVGNFGSRHRRAYAAIGTLVSLANHSCSRSSDGALMVSSRTLTEAGEPRASEGEFVEERF